MSTTLFLNTAEASDMESSLYDLWADSQGSLKAFIYNNDINIADAVYSDISPKICHQRSCDSVDDDLYESQPPTKKYSRTFESQ
jgi:hypothetical protein